VKKIVLSLSLAAAMFVSTAGVHAESNIAEGSWKFSTNGQAVLGAPTSGSCQASGTTLGQLNDVGMDLSGGQIVIHNLGISIGATNCSSPNFQGTGTYTVTDRADGSYQIDGSFTSQFVGRPAACSGTSLTNVTFTLVGPTSDKPATITITGLASGSYAEGPPPGPLSCTAPILNLTGTGSATKF
jgi:hypothetical protein